MTKPFPPKIARPREDMVLALRRHVRLLEAYIREARDERDNDYLGEIAGKLRVLVTTSGSNTPLLLSLGKEFGIDTPADVGDGSPVQGRLCGAVTWPQLLDSLAAAIRLPGTDELASVSFNQLIRSWSEHSGGAHEDWSMDEAVRRLITNPTYLGDMQIMAHQLIAVANMAVAASQAFLKALDGLRVRDFKILQSGWIETTVLLDGAEVPIELRRVRLRDADEICAAIAEMFEAVTVARTDPEPEVMQTIRRVLSESIRLPKLPQGHQFIEDMAVVRILDALIDANELSVGLERHRARRALARTTGLAGERESWTRPKT